MAAVDFSVVVCTWNRAKSLVRLLDSFLRLETPPGLRWELLVVDNNSSDDTSAAALQFRERFPLRLLHEPKQGKSNALNLASREARGTWMLYADDDQAAHPEWLRAHLAGVRGSPEYDFFGGPILPELEEPPEPWLRQAWDGLRGIYGWIDLGEERRDLSPTLCAFGGNWLVRTEVQRRFPYLPELGRNGAVLAGGEETFLQSQLLAAGHRGRWNPGAPMRHFIPRSRATLEHVLHLLHGCGAASEWQRARETPKSAWAARRRRWSLARKLALAWLNLGLHVATRDHVRWYKHRFAAELLQGRLDAACAGNATVLELARARKAA